MKLPKLAKASLRMTADFTFTRFAVSFCWVHITNTYYRTGKNQNSWILLQLFLSSKGSARWFWYWICTFKCEFVYLSWAFVVILLCKIFFKNLGLLNIDKLAKRIFDYFRQSCNNSEQLSHGLFSSNENISDSNKQSNVCKEVKSLLI